MGVPLGTDLLLLLDRSKRREKKDETDLREGLEVEFKN